MQNEGVLTNVLCNRWDLYDGVADVKDLNCHWVKLRLDIQGELVTLL